MARKELCALLVFVVTMTFAGIAAAQQTAAQLAGALAQQPLQSSDDVETVLPVRPDFYLIAGLGGNIVVQIGPAGVILVDAGSVQTADKVLSVIKRLTSRPI